MYFFLLCILNQFACTCRCLFGYCACPVLCYFKQRHEQMSILFFGMCALKESTILIVIVILLSLLFLSPSSLSLSSTSTLPC